MEKAAKGLNFIEAARFRDEMLGYQAIIREKVKLFHLFCAKYFLWVKYQISPKEAL